MEPGRELDALVAEKVMAYTRNADGSFLNAVGYHLSADNVCAEEYNRLPHFSTDIAAAWEVVEKLRPRFEFNAFVYENGVRVAFWKKRTCGEIAGFCVADEIPHAICLAALKALEVPHTAA